MNALEQFKRKLELRDKKLYGAGELADILCISTSYYYKLNGGFMPITGDLKNKMKLALASDK
jgi:hypothetical protein